MEIIRGNDLFIVFRRAVEVIRWAYVTTTSMTSVTGPMSMNIIALLAPQAGVGGYVFNTTSAMIVHMYVMTFSEILSSLVPTSS